MIKAKNSKYGIVYKNGNFLAPNGKKFSKDQMKEFIKKSKGVNRIHKPMSLLFYIDVINNKIK